MDHLTEYAQQQDYIHGSVAPEDAIDGGASIENAASAATGGSGNGYNESAGSSNPRLALRKLGSLAGKGKRNSKPRAKSATFTPVS